MGPAQQDLMSQYVPDTQGTVDQSSFPTWTLSFSLQTFTNNL